MRSVSTKRSLLLAAVALGLGGCAVGPDFVAPVPPSGAGYTLAPLPDSLHLAAGEAVPYDWWTHFQSPKLNALVAKALAANADLAAARSALRQAQELVYAQEGYFFPSLQSGYAFERQELAGNSGSGPGYQGNGSNLTTNQQATAPYNTPAYYNTHTSQMTLSYVPDLFGGNLRAVESLRAQAQGQHYAMQAVYVTLTTNVVVAAFTEAGLRQQIQATQQIIDANTRLLAIVKTQRARGFASAMDVAAQQQALAQALQLMPPLAKQIQQNRDLMRLLVGQLPNQDVDDIFTMDDFHLPSRLPLSVPGDLLRQRPDVLAAQAALHAANANVGVAIANRLPQPSITAAQGGTASQFAQMYSNGGPFWDVIGSVTQVMFDGNTLLHRQRAADQALLQAAQQYRSVMLGAYQNVADTLHALAADDVSLAAAQQAELAAQVVQDKTRQQMQAGLVPPSALYAAQQNYQQAVVIRAGLQANRFSDVAALFDALGGGWWNRPDLAEDSQRADFFQEWFTGTVEKWDSVRPR